MPRGGKAKTRDDPERRCIATGEVQPKRGLIRFAIGPDGQIVPDVLEKLPGRGIWVAAEREALTTAVTKRLFARGAKQSVTVSETLVNEVESLLVKRPTSKIALMTFRGGYPQIRTPPAL